MNDPQIDELYALASAEFNSENRDKGLWAKCFADSDGDENKAKALYLRIRVSRIQELGEQKKTPSENESTQTDLTKKEPSERHEKIGGWLLFFVLSMMLGSALNFSNGTTRVFTEETFTSQFMIHKQVDYETANELAKKRLKYFYSNPDLKSLGTYDYITSLIWFPLSALQLAAAIGIALQRKFGLKLVHWFLWITLAYGILNLLIVSSLGSNPAVKNWVGGSLAESMGTVVLASPFFLFGIWYSYFKKSKRVRNTAWK